MVKVALIGAGSAVFAQTMITDILAIEGLDEGTFALVDLDRERLELAHEVAEQLIKLVGKSWTVQATTERRSVLPGCDYVMNMIEVGGLANVHYDYNIPAKYGVDQCIADTSGPGGLFKYLRTAPTWLAICRDIEELCPRALVINFTNPLSAMTLTALHATSLQVVGLCHSIRLKCDRGTRAEPAPGDLWQCLQQRADRESTPGRLCRSSLPGRWEWSAANPLRKAAHTACRAR